MNQRRRQPGAFPLVGVLVATACAALLIALLIMALQGRPAAAPRSAAALPQALPYAAAAWCLPPECNAMDPGRRDVSLFHPVIPDRFDSGATPEPGIWVSFGAAQLPQQPFGLHATAAAPGDPFVGLGPDFDAVGSDRLDVAHVEIGATADARAPQQDADWWRVVNGLGVGAAVRFTAAAVVVSEAAR